MDRKKVVKKGTRLVAQSEGSDGPKTLGREWCIAAVRRFLAGNEMEFSEKCGDDGVEVFAGVIHNPAATPVDSFPYHVEVDVEDRQGFVTCSFLVPSQARRKVRAAVAAYCNYISGSVPVVKMLVNSVSGDVEAETALPVSALAVDANRELGGAFATTMTLFESFLPGLYKVFEGEDPEKTFHSAYEKMIEGDGSKGQEPFEEACAPAGETSSPNASLESGAPCARLAKDYSLEGLNIVTAIAPARIVGAVKKFNSEKAGASPDAPRLNLLLSGPPGTGKTEFVKYLAQEIGRPLVALKASDLLSSRVGETEKGLATAFARAKEKGAILFLDEIDSFLQRRESALHGWEVTQVNELLQQMENFGGVLVGATNFLENLDPAVLRRFTYKVKLDYLTVEGKRIFFKRFFGAGLAKDEQARLDAIERLTPGDFRTVRQQLWYLDETPTNAQRLDALEAESAAKGGSNKRKVGF